MGCLDTVSNLASILTAICAAIATVYLWLDQLRKRQRLESYLKKEMLINRDGSCHSVVHLMAELGMTEGEILHASFASRHIVRKSRKDDGTGLASQILFSYSETPKQELEAQQSNRP